MSTYKYRDNGLWISLGDPQSTRTKSPIEAAPLSAYGDDFQADTLDAAWTARNCAPTFPYTSPGSYITLDARGDGIFRAAPPDAEFEVVAEFDYLGGGSNSSSSQTAGHLGVAILNASGTGVSGAIHTADPPRIWIHDITAYEYVGVLGVGLDPAGAMKYDRVTLAIHKNGTNYRVRYSNNGGTTWSAYTATSSKVFTPTQIGIIRAHTGGSAVDNVITVRHFNVFIPSFV